MIEAVYVAPWWGYRWWGSQSTTFLCGDILVLRCWGEKFDVMFGDAHPYQGLALVSLMNQEVKTVGLGYTNIVSLDAVGGKLYLGTDESIPSPDGNTKPACAYFLQEIDVAVPSTGPSVNVPGLFVQYDPAADLLTLRDEQWDEKGSLRSALRTLAWDGTGPVQPIDEVALPDGISMVMGRGARVYADAYTSDGYQLYAASVGPDGDLSLSEGLLVTHEWGSLLDAQGTTAYITIGNAVAAYDFSGEGAYAGMEQTMGYPVSMRFGVEDAYVLLGYSGFVRLAL
jgi:hypothetical protein